jgi:UDP:flavonoid glycosyltransferase YjiC (YdhE family)
MSRIIVAATPLTGHAKPLLTIAHGLVERGHDVTILTGSKFRPQALSTGARVVDLPGLADFDETDMSTAFPGHGDTAPGPDQLNFSLKHVFADVIPDQHAALQELLVNGDESLVCDAYFLGAWPVLLGAPGIRPRRTIGVGISVLTQLSDTTTLMGPVPGLDGEAARAAHREANGQLRAALAPGQEHLAAVLAGTGVRQEVPFLIDGLVTVPDWYAQLTVEEFEFAAGDAPPTVRFVGPVPAVPPAGYARPAWWDDLGRCRAVVVTQGTLANEDLGLLIKPALAALAGEDVLVIATVGRDAARLDGAVPANARVEEFVPYDLLLPHADVLVTNGGYGGVQQALALGVPIVVGGATEDKPFVAARVAAFGVGLDLGPAPAAQDIRTAVRVVRADPSFKAAAMPIREAIAKSDALGAIEELITETGSERS